VTGPTDLSQRRGSDFGRKAHTGLEHPCKLLIFAQGVITQWAPFAHRCTWPTRRIGNSLSERSRATPPQALATVLQSPSIRRGSTLGVPRWDVASVGSARRRPSRHRWRRVALGWRDVIAYHRARSADLLSSCDGQPWPGSWVPGSYSASCSVDVVKTQPAPSSRDLVRCKPGAGRGVQGCFF
jgi:hypothetical protein